MIVDDRGFCMFAINCNAGLFEMMIHWVGSELRNALSPLLVIHRDSQNFSECHHES